MYSIKYLLLITIVNLSFQCVVSIEFLRELFFPRRPILNRVRNLNLAKGFNEPQVLDFIGLVENYGYFGEEHNLTTEDGYKLIIHRISGSEKSPPTIGKPIVLLQHGFLATSDFWVLTEPKSNLAFTMVDNGYDVWVGNIRGNSYCRSHEKLSTSYSKFWDFTYHEHAVYDLAKIIDYTLDITGEKTIVYVGHSMGTTMSYVLLSEKPNYNEKIKLVISLAPVAYWKVGPFEPAWIIVRDNFELIKRFLIVNNIYEVVPLTNNLIKFTTGICGGNIILKSTCIASLFLFTGSNPDQVNSTLITRLLTHFPAGSSIKNMDHYKQNAVQRLFRRYDYGKAKNYKFYGMKQPPQYNVKKITAPVALIYSLNDAITLEENVIELSERLPNVVELYKIPDENFNHIDYIWARDVKFLLNDKILEILSRY